MSTVVEPIYSSISSVWELQLNLVQNPSVVQHPADTWYSAPFSIIYCSCVCGAITLWLQSWSSLMTLYKRQGPRPSPRKRNAEKQNGCLRRPVLVVTCNWARVVQGLWPYLSSCRCSHNLGSPAPSYHTFSSGIHKFNNSRHSRSTQNPSPPHLL